MLSSRTLIYLFCFMTCVRSSTRVARQTQTLIMQRAAISALRRAHSALRPNAVNVPRAYHDKVIDHYENPR